MYADDMVVWARDKQEMTRKLEALKEIMDRLGLKMSIEKTELQLLDGCRKL